MDDLVLWVKFVEGDDKAYSTLYERYLDSLFSFGMGFTHDREVVKDCIHDVFTKFFRDRHQLLVPKNVKLYLFISLKNALFNYFNRDESFRYVSRDAVDYSLDELEFDVEFSVEDKIVSNEERQEIVEQINRLIIEILTPRQKEIIYYRYIEEMKLEDICELMELNYQSALNLLQRSFNKIRKHLKTNQVRTDNTVKIISLYGTK